MSSNKILEEYYQIFGRKQYDNLFDLGDESYKTFRQEILNAPLEYFDKQKPPFENYTIERHKNNVVHHSTPHAHDSLLEINTLQKKNRKISNIIGALLVNRISFFSPIFYLKANKSLMARGYYEPNEKLFHILPGSTVSLKVSSDYSKINSIIRKQTFLDKACQKEKRCYRVVTDFACTSAKEAVDFILGKNADQDLWKDDQGNCFSNHVKKLSQANNSFEDIQDTNHLFYINQDTQTGDFRKGVGYYQPDLKCFVVKRGSVLIFNSKNKDAGTKFIMDKCEYIYDIYYLLKKDITFSSPSAAAAVCTGKKVNGWQHWVDECGNTLKEFYGN